WDEEGDDGHPEQGQHRPSVLGHQGQVAGADDGSHVDHRQGEDTEPDLASASPTGHQSALNFLRAALVRLKMLSSVVAGRIKTAKRPSVYTAPPARGRAWTSKPRAAASRSSACLNSSTTTAASSVVEQSRATRYSRLATAWLAPPFLDTFEQMRRPSSVNDRSMLSKARRRENGSRASPHADAHARARTEMPATRTRTRAPRLTRFCARPRP